MAPTRSSSRLESPCSSKGSRPGHILLAGANCLAPQQPPLPSTLTRPLLETSLLPAPGWSGPRRAPPGPWFPSKPCCAQAERQQGLDWMILTRPFQLRIFYAAAPPLQTQHKEQQGKGSARRCLQSTCVCAALPEGCARISL